MYSNFRGVKLTKILLFGYFSDFTPNYVWKFMLELGLANLKLLDHASVDQYKCDSNLALTALLPVP